MGKQPPAVWSGPLHNTAKDRPAKEPTRVLIVDDHPIVIAGCRALLADDAKIVITEVADAESGAASFTGRSARCLPYRYQLARRLRLRAARRILRLDAAARIIMFSIHNDPIFAARRLKRKATSPNRGDPNDLIVAIREVSRGDVFLPPSIARSLVRPATVTGPLLLGREDRRVTSASTKSRIVISATCSGKIGKNGTEFFPKVRVARKSNIGLWQECMTHCVSGR